MYVFIFFISLSIIVLSTEVMKHGTDQNKYQFSLLDARIGTLNDMKKTFYSFFYADYASDDALSPYINKHGSRLSHRSIRECHQEKYGSPPHEIFLPKNVSNADSSFVKVKRFVKEIKTSLLPRTVRGHYVVISNSFETLSVLEPDQPGGCALNIRQTVPETSEKNKCFVAMNAGYFDTKQGKCLGNVISDGRKAHSSNGVQNTHFGITEDGQIFIGYLSEETFLAGNLKQLVGGVVWILRNGTGFVNRSKNLECEDTEETGPMENFVSILSARSAVGHDKEGNVVLVQVDGKSNVDGINLYEMEEFLKELGLVNAINLDGGGSSTLVINGTTVNYPYDSCTDDSFSCDRKVSTVLCVHSPYCHPMDCNKHGTCSMGKCICEENWLPPHCDHLFCGVTNCSSHGVCFSEGCVCYPGYFGNECNQSCNEGWYGSMCKKSCQCFNSNGCDPVTGSCNCKSGFKGKKCDQPCSMGYFGINCQYKCQCNSSCCSPINGACDITHNSSDIYSYADAQCIAEHIIKEQNLVKDNSIERRKCYFAIIILGIITAICLASLLLVLCCSCSCFCQNEQVLCFKKNKKSHKKYPLQVPSGYLSASSSDSEEIPLKKFQKS